MPGIVYNEQASFVVVLVHKLGKISEGLDLWGSLGVQTLLRDMKAVACLESLRQSIDLLPVSC